MQLLALKLSYRLQQDFTTIKSSVVLSVRLFNVISCPGNQAVD